MPLNLSETMAEVTRLTRAGKLTEAMALLQGPKGDPASTAAPAPSATRPLLDGSAVQKTIEALASTRLGAVVRKLGVLGGEPDAHGSGDHSFTNAAGSRSYKLYVPPGAESRPLPLVVMLHGCTQSPDDFAAGTRMNQLGEEFGFFVAYPAQSAAANQSRCWNWFNDTEQKRDAGEPSLVAGITREIMREHAIDPDRVYVAGLSAGGAAAAIMGAAYPDLYAAIGVHSGLACGAARDMTSAFQAMRQGGASAPRTTGHPLPAIVFHGDQDTTVHPVNGDQVIAQAKADGRFTASTNQGRSPGGVGYTRTVQTNGDGEAMLEQWVLHGAGHAWSGGDRAGSYTDPNGPDASREMVRFFLAHPKRRPSA